MAEDKKTQIGPPGGHRPGRPPTGPAAIAVATTTPAPTGTPAPVAPAPVASGTTAPDTSPPTPRSTSYVPQTDDPLIGKTLADRYIIRRKLGEGGMGAVYLATHLLLEKQVALKILHGEFARKPDLVTRFMQEAKAASRIRHENVIDISDFGSTPDGLVFFAMELLDGHDLHELVARARLEGSLLPWARSKKIFLQICSALTAAHAQGIVHRDLKPENIYLVDFLGDPDFVKLLDFGIAKLTEAADAGERKLTRTGMLFGTPEYMSPEQARGENVDHRVDIYAMGCILHQLVTGRVPFEAENFMGVLSLHLTEPPKRVPDDILDHIDAPRALADVIDRALAKDRNVRYQTIEELANAVRTVSGDPLPAARGGRAASVPGPRPATTPAPRSQSSPGAPASGTPVPIAPEPTNRTRTAWTGNLSIPEEAAPQARGKSKMPLAIGALVVVAGAAVAIVMATRGGSNSAATPGSASNAPLVQAPVIADAALATPPPPPPQPKLPDSVAINLDSVPAGATVIEVATGKPVGKTPFTLHIPGSSATRRYLFQLHGYGDETYEVVPDHGMDFTMPMKKGAGATSAVHVSDPAKHPDAGLGSGSAAATVPVTHPDGAGSAVRKPDTKPDAKKPDHDCSDDDPPCLKQFPGSNQ